MTTKEKILSAALKLFNERGTDTITTRHIATEITISHGNLCYHYPNKEDIIKNLYYLLVSELDSIFSEASSNEISFHLLNQMLKSTFSIQLKYKFFLMEIVKIMRTIPEIRTHFKELYKKREIQLTFITQQLIDLGYFNKSLFNGDFTPFIKLFYLIGDFWLSEAEILFNGTEDEKLEKYCQLSKSYFIPYLTSKGMQEYIKSQ